MLFGGQIAYAVIHATYYIGGNFKMTGRRCSNNRSTESCVLLNLVQYEAEASATVSAQVVSWGRW